MSSRTQSRVKAPYELAFVDRVMLVLEDAGGEPLQRLLLDRSLSPVAKSSSNACLPLRSHWLKLRVER
jgi:hypothetical protein